MADVGSLFSSSSTAAARVVTGIPGIGVELSPG